MPWAVIRGQFRARRGGPPLEDARCEIWYDDGFHIPRCEMYGTWYQVERFMLQLPKDKRIVEEFDPTLGIVSQWVDEQ